MKFTIFILSIILLMGCQVKNEPYSVVTDKVLTYNYMEKEIFHDSQINKRAPPPRTADDFIALQKSARGGNPDSYYLLARLYFRDSICNVRAQRDSEYDKNCEIAFKFYHKTLEINSNHSMALHLIGASYQWGWGVKKDLARAIPFYERAAELGNVSSCHNLFDIYIIGNGDIVKNIEKAKYYAEKAANSGSEKYKYVIDNWSDALIHWQMIEEEEKEVEDNNVVLD
nr:tetratricopeptide repeat protein [uncultured Moellerella sp.]